MAPPYDAVRDAEPMRRHRVQMTRAGALARLSAAGDAMLAERGLPAMGGQIVGATVVEARRRPRLTEQRQRGLARATARITLADLACTMRRPAQIEGRGAPA